MTRPAGVLKTPRRIWTYPKGQWLGGPILYRGGDEYGRFTLLLRLPGQRAIVWAYRWCRDPECCDLCPGNGFPHSGWSNGQVICEHCNPGSTACPQCGALNYTCPCFDTETAS